MKRFPKNRRLHHALKYFFLFIVTSALFFLIIERIRADRVNEHLEAEKELTSATYQSVVQGFKSQADIIFYNRINVPEIVDLYRGAWSADAAERDLIRKELYRLLLPVYRNISLYHLKQLHFHLKNSDSFLRFHRPERFGDSLIGIRDTVAYVNETRQPIVGFEEGRIFNGYRFVYPLFGGTDYLGSAEVSIAMQTILEAIRDNIHANVDFIILAETVKSKVFEEEQKNYFPCTLFKDFMHENTLMTLSDPGTEMLIKKYIGKHGSLDAKLAEGNAFNFYESQDGTVHIVSFVPVVNAVSNKTVAYLILDRKHKDLSFILLQPNIFLFAITALLGLLFFLLYRAAVQRETIETEKLQFQSLINLQGNIVILTDSTRLEYANRYFFDTFKFSSLEQFKAQHQCICDLFVQDDRFFHLGKVPENSNWLETLKAAPATQRIVSMKDAEGTQRIYTVAANAFAEGRYIVSFTDISLTMNNQTQLERRAAHDKLTGAYNREFIDSNFDRISQTAKAMQKRVGVIMIDLDHFKKINDTYGHNRGDAVLKSFVSIVRLAVRQEDYIIRWGGEEFLLLLMVENERNLDAIAENIRARIETAAFEAIGHITSSFGVTLYHEGELFSETVERADKALYNAKASGRNSVVSLH